MQAERWRKVEELYQAATAVPPERRTEFLAQACGDDAALREEVQSLFDQQTDGFLLNGPLAVKTLSAGMKLGNFEIVELIGRGGMGEVYRARDSRLKREVAIKILPAALARDPDRIVRFEREARAAGGLNHPNIVAIHETGREGDTYWIASELVAGEPLGKLMERGPIAVRKAIEIAVQIADGLAVAHAAGIVHRDLKPANVMVTREGRVKILDFGLAMRRRTSQDSTTLELTDEGTVLGTAGYMSPEQVRGEALDQRSDLFSFGVILYEMLAGKRAFAGGSSVEVMNAILKEEPGELPSSLPQGLNQIVRRCLEKDRERRFQTAADLAFAMVIPSLLPSSPRSRQHRSWPAWAAGVAVCLAATAAAYLWGVRSRPVSIAGDTTLRRLTIDNGLTTDATLSSDGKLAVYASDRADSTNLDIWVQQIDGGGTVRLTDDPADDYDPSISPDGSQVAFRSERNGGGIYVVPALGGEARLLIPNGRRPRFSPDGQWLMYSVGDGDDFGTVELFAQRLSGGKPAQIGAGCEVMALSTLWAPNGSHILFDGRCPENGNKETVWASTIDGRRTAWLPLAQFVIDQAQQKPSRLLIPFAPFQVEASDEASITAIPISPDGTKVTGPAERLTFGTGSEAHASAANGLVVLSSVNRQDHVWSIPVDPTGHANGAPRQVTSGSAGEYIYYLSRDGQKLLLGEGRRDHHQLYLKDLRTGKAQEIPWEGFLLSFAVLSPDASKIMFTNYANSRRDPSGFIYEVSVAGGIPRKIWGEAKHYYGLWDWSPDGSTVLYFSGGAVEELDARTYSRTKFLSDPGCAVWQAHFSPDGRWVAFNCEKNGRSQVFVTPFRKELAPRSEWIQIADTGWEDKPHFSANGKVISFSSDRDGYRCLWAQAVGPDMHPTGAPFAVYHAHERRRSFRNFRNTSFNLAVGPDTIAFGQEERTGNIWLLEPAKKGAN